MNKLGLYHGMEILEELSANCPDHGVFKRYRTKAGERGRCGRCEEEGERRRQEEFYAQERASRITAMLRYERSGLPERFAEKDFESYNAATEGQKKALAGCREYIAQIEERVNAGACLVLIGPPGVGKTHLLVATARAAIYCAVHARYSTMTGFLAKVRGAWAWHADEHGADFRDPRLLVLDDLWIPQSGRDRESLIAMLDERYLAQKPTLIGSNLPWPEMKKEIGERFCDRLLEGGGKVLALDGKSMRGRL